MVPGLRVGGQYRFSREGKHSSCPQQYCGLGHDYMWSKLKVVPKGLIAADRQRIREEQYVRQVKSVALAESLGRFAAFFVAIILGLYQVMNRSGLFPELESHELYFASVSTHGVLMGFVLTTFFIMGFGCYTATTTLKRPFVEQGSCLGGVLGRPRWYR